jgi:hypothetical protein
MDAFGPVGVIGRPSGDATVESAVAFVGADGSHPIALSFLDHGRRAVIDAVGLAVDETVLYTSKAVVKIQADGTVEVRSLGGTAAELALLSDAQALNARIATVEAAFNAFLVIWAPFVASYPAPPSGPGVPSEIERELLIETDELTTFAMEV